MTDSSPTDPDDLAGDPAEGLDTQLDGDAATASTAEPAPEADPDAATGDDIAGGDGGGTGSAETEETKEAKPPSTIPCIACGELLLVGARFCEACGARSGEGAAAGGTGAPSETASGAAAPGAGEPCVKCQSPVAADGYCTMCGHKAIEPVTVDDRDVFAYATHRGRRHERNEDAAALAATSEGWPVLVVSDGVSVSPNPHLASAAAVAAAADRLAGRPFAGPDDLVAAVAGAHAAACAIPHDTDPEWLADGTHPACTIVVAVATDTELHVANVGDARAHLLTEETEETEETGETGGGWRATQLTTDDSVAAQAVADGIELDVALALPGGHAITAWLGADAPAVTPHLAVCPLAAGEVVLATSDGLWNYAATDEALSDLVTTTLPPAGELREAPGLGARCEQLVSWAVDQGGADNVTVAIAPAPGADHHDIEQEEPA